MNCKALIALSLSLALTSAPLVAGTYKWVDKNNKIHYSSTPPPDVDVKATVIKTPTKASSSQQDEIKAFEAIKQKEKQAELDAEEAKEQAKKDEEKKALKRKNCKIAKQKLASYADNQRIRYQNAKGEWTFMTDDARAAKVRESQEDVDHYCRDLL